MYAYIFLSRTILFGYFCLQHIEFRLHSTSLLVLVVPTKIDNEAICEDLRIQKDKENKVLLR